MGEAQENPPLKGVPERQRGWGMFVRLFDTLWVNPINIPLRRFAFATRRGPPSKGEFPCGRLTRFNCQRASVCVNPQGFNRICIKS